MFCHLIDSEDGKLLNLILEALYEMMKKAQDYFGNEGGNENPLLANIEEIGLAEKIADLQSHSSEAVYRKAQKLLSEFWETDDDW